VASDRRFTRAFGDNAGFDRAEKLIILLDKYDALRRRGGRSHEQALAWLRERLGADLCHGDRAQGVVNLHRRGVTQVRRFCSRFSMPRTSRSRD
jgi:hypothetical protein